MPLKIPSSLIVWWAQRAPRERTLLSVMAVVLGLALVVGAWLQPALREVRRLPQEIEASRLRLEHLQQLAQQAREWQGTGLSAAGTRLTEGTAWTDADRSRLLAPFSGCARLEPMPTGWNLVLQTCTADALREGLAHLRSQTAGVPARARLQPGAQGTVDGSIEWRWSTP